MIKTLKRLIVSALAVSLFVAPLAVVPVASAAADFNLKGSVCGGTKVELNSTTDDCTTGDEAGNQVNNAVKLGLNLFSAIVGIIAVVMIIVGGIKYITSGGDSNNISGAKNAIMYAVIGLVVVALAQIIVNFVLERFVGGSQ
jgi:hypothetical protein